MGKVRRKTGKAKYSLVFTTTAVGRPDVIQKTYRSFSKNLVGINLKNYRLVINVDPMPNRKSAERTVEVARTFFSDVEYRIPNKPNFTAAVQWCWSTADTRFIFHLEDDWRLTTRVKMDTLMQHFQRNLTPIQVLLRAYKYKYRKMALSPSIIRRNAYSAVNLNTSINPEIQLSAANLVSWGVEGPIARRVVVYPKKRVIVRDIGRHWLQHSGFRRPKRKSQFTKWVK